MGCNFRPAKSYYDPRFVCFNEAGWQNQKDFKQYIEKIWLPVRLSYNEDNKSKKSSRVVFVGNSLMHLFLPELIKKEFPTQNVTNRGIGGDMTETLLARIEEDVLVLSPSVIVIEIGGNDMIQGKCLSLIQRNFKSIIEIIHKKNASTRVIVMAVPPTKVRELNQIVPVHNLFLADFARKTKNVEYVEVWDDLRDPDELFLRDEFTRESGDKLHFNEKGYEVWGKKLRPLVP
ncbi:GDSL-type esterase/lipase family protein [Leptospira sp. 'Mane']|uniref:GDSL-type esterase/lipase family protein n=1 Tax=Leptospira sp. 'Mane' TaxID=3387407 RepID=UPI00398BB4A7